MTSVQLFAQYQEIPGAVPPGITGYYQQIDLSMADPIAISNSVFDLEDPTVVPSSYSQDFLVPATPGNSVFFSNAFEINAEGFNPARKVLAYINAGGRFFQEGYLTLQKIILDGIGQTSEFELQFIGQVRTFGGAIEEKYLKDLDLSAYNHLLTFNNILLSWNAGTSSPALLNGDVLYPLVEYGYDYNKEINRPIDTTLSVYNGTTSVKGFTNSSNPLLIQQFRPFVKAKVIWDRIFTEAGFTYDSTFLESDPRFTDLYFVTTATADSQLFRGSPFSNSFGTPVIVALPTGIAQYIRIVFATDPPEQDYYNAYDPTLGLYTCPLNIPYMTHVMSLRFEYGTFSSGPSADFTIRLQRNRPSSGITTVWSQTLTGLPPNTSGNSQFGQSFSAVLGAQQVGDIFSWEIQFALGAFRNVRLSGMRWTILYPKAVNLSMMFPEDDYTQAEFIKGITSKFNLVWQADPVVPNNFIIEPWNSWIVSGRQYSWSDVINEAFPVEIEPLFLSGRQKVTFADEGDTDLNNDLYEKRYSMVYGQLNLDTGIEILEGVQNIQTNFIPVPLSPIGLSNTFLIPHFAVDTETERTPMKVGPRLVYYNGLKTVPSIEGVPMTYYVLSDLNVSTPLGYYPLVSQYAEWPPDSDTFNLNFANSPNFWDPTTNSGYDGLTGVNAYTIYWQKWYETFYSPYSKVMTATFKLDSKDIQNLRFNDLIWIKNAWWFPIEYTDFEIGKSQNQEVKLVKYWGDFNLVVGGTGAAFSEQSNICYSLTDNCQACCCDTGSTIVTVWTNGTSFSNSTFVYSTPVGGVPNPGWYAQGAYAYFVEASGFISTVFVCSSCSCGGILPEFLTEYTGCSGPTPCEAWCCSDSTSIWIDGGITGADQLFSSAGADPLSPFNWYHVPGTAWIYQVGANGYSIVQGTTGGSCECPVNDYELFLSRGDGTFEDAEYGVCCLFGMTGASGPISIFTDGPDIINSTSYCYDPFCNEVVGPVYETWLSDGQYFVGVSGGAVETAYSTCTANVCDGRNNFVNVRVVNDSGIYGDIVCETEISIDDVNWFFANQTVANGVSWDSDFDTKYLPNSFFRIDHQTLTDASIKVDVYKNTNLEFSIITDTLPSGDFYVSPSFLVGTDTWEVEIFTYPI